MMCFQVSPEWQNDIDLAIILVRAQPFSDREDLLPVCWRCGTTNAMLNPQVRAPRDPSPHAHILLTPVVH
jgi:intraflagellar transport protein 122